MQELEKILEEIDNLKSECLNGEYEPAYGAGALDMANAIKDIIRSLSRENDPEITRSSQDSICGECSRRKWYRKGYEDGKKSNAGWIPVEDRMPDESLNSVIGWDEYRERRCFVQYYGGRWILGNGEPVNIIAWRPLPEPYRPERSEP